MAQLLIEAGRVIQADIFTIHPSAGVASLGEIGENIRVFALAVTHDRGENLETGAFRVGEKRIHDLLGALSGDFRPAFRAVLHPGARVEQT